MAERPSDFPARPVTPKIAEERHLPREVRGSEEPNIHPILGQIGVGASLWFLIIVWLSFAAGTDTGLPLAMVTLVFVVSFGLLMLVGSYSWYDPRWSFPQRNRSRFPAMRSGSRIRTRDR